MGFFMTRCYLHTSLVFTIILIGWRSTCNSMKYILDGCLGFSAASFQSFGTVSNDWNVAEMYDSLQSLEFTKYGIFSPLISLCKVVKARPHSVWLFATASRIFVFTSYVYIRATRTRAGSRKIWKKNVFTFWNMCIISEIKPWNRDMGKNRSINPLK